MSNLVNSLFEGFRQSYTPATGRARSRINIQNGVLLGTFFPAHVQGGVPETAKMVSFKEWTEAFSVLSNESFSACEAGQVLARIHESNTSSHMLMQDTGGSLYYVGPEWCYKFSVVKSVG